MGNGDKALQTACSRTHDEPDTPRGILSPARVAALWARMAGLYGHRWASSYGEDPEGPTGDTWARALGDMRNEDLARGVRACSVSVDEWPPSLPGFRKLCLGIPDFAEVVPLLAAGAPEPTPFVRLVWRYLDPYALRMANAGADRAMMRDAYNLAAAYVSGGGALPEDAPRIEHDPRAELAYYEAEHFRRMREFAAGIEIAARDDDASTIESPECDSGVSSPSKKGVDIE